MVFALSCAHDDGQKNVTFSIFSLTNALQVIIKVITCNTFKH